MSNCTEQNLTGFKKKNCSHVNEETFLLQNMVTLIFS